MGSSLLGLSLEGSRLEGAVLRRSNGSVEISQAFSTALSLEPLTNAPELVGREIRKQLDAANIRERRCVVCLPLNWILTLTTKLPDLPEQDAASFLQMEAERNFPYGPEALMLAHSRHRSPGGDSYATLVAVPREHVTRLETILRAANLKPVSFTLGIVSFPLPSADANESLVVLAPGDNSVGLEVHTGGGPAALRAIEGAYEIAGGDKRILADHVARELRITLGQLPSDVRDSIRRLSILGPSDAAEELTETLGPLIESLDLDIQHTKTLPARVFNVQVPSGTPVSPAISLGLRWLTGQAPELEFLPPRVSAWKQLAGRYSSRRLVYTGAAVGVLAALVALAFLVQQWQLLRWQSQWKQMAPRVTALEKMQQEIRLYRPWFDDSYRSLGVLRRLSEAFPEDGAVSAKTVEIRESSVITCSGTARDNPALLRTLDKLRGIPEVTALQVDQIRGRSPLQFTFNFRWAERGAQ
ncbi:MAG TPA: hypothetical protein P5055_12870 [Candidatus Paceibacterota bacterium]|nr:hypothetical protein [Verrucomicrobiota bacterium]HSA01621.1 hypothetical protein [Candidatus Paceibacterota bacterium]